MTPRDCDPKAIALMLAMLVVFSAPSDASAADTSGVYRQTIEALDSLDGYRGSRFTRWEGKDAALMEGREAKSHYCVDQKNRSMRSTSEGSIFSGDSVAIGDQTYARTAGSARWMTFNPRAREYPPALRRLTEHALPPKDLGVEEIEGVKWRHYRGRYDVEEIIEQAKAERYAHGGSFAPVTEKRLRNAHGRSFFELWVDSSSVSRKIREVRYSDTDLDLYEVSETQIEIGCDERIVEPEFDERSEPRPQPTGLAVIHYTGSERREIYGGECYWMGSSGAGTHTMSYFAPDSTLSFDLATTGEQFEFEESFSERPDLVYGSANWSRGDDIYDVSFGAGSVELAPDLLSFAVEGTIVDYRQEGSSDRIPLSEPTPVSFQVTCPNEPSMDPTKGTPKRKTTPPPWKIEPVPAGRVGDLHCRSPLNAGCY